MSAISKSMRREKSSINFHKQNELLQNAAEENGRLREQISKQSYSDSIVQVQIQEKISKVKEKALTLAKNLESQKRKNLELQAIIRNMNHLREQSRKAEADHNDNNENIENLSRRLKKYEYNLEQLYSKMNNLTSKTKNRKSEVDTFRTQRVIDSNIFDSIEKELKGYEIDYKKLLIQKIKLEKQCTKKLDNYSKIKQQIAIDSNPKNSRPNIATNRLQSVKHKNTFPEEEFFSGAPQIQQAIKFTEIGPNARESHKIHHNSSKKLINNPGQLSGFTNYSNFKKDTKNISKQKNQEYECKISRILVNVGLDNDEELIHHLENLDITNDELYKQSNKYNDEISQRKQELTEVLKQISNKEVKYYEKGQPDEKDQNRQQAIQKRQIKLRKKLRKIECQADRQSQQIFSCIKSAEFNSILDLCGLGDQINKWQSLDQVQEMIEKIELKLTPLCQIHMKKKKSEEEKNNDEPILKQSTNIKLKQNEIQPNQNSCRSNIDEIINKVKKMEPSQKIMEKQDFKREYEALRKTGNQSTKNMRGTKKKTTKKQRSVFY